MAKSIFDESNEIKSRWQKWESVGDSIEGTLISIREVHNAMYDKNQTVYEIKKENGEVWNVGGKPAIDAQLKYVKLGQVIGMKYVELRKPTKPGMSGTKIIKCFANPGVVDKEWLAEQADVAAATPQPEEVTSDLPFETETEA